MSTVTASLNGLSSADVLVTVSATAVAPAVAGDVTLSGNRELTIPAGQTESTGEVRVTAVGNTVDAPNKSVEVTASVTGGNGVTAPDSRTLTITDDEVLPVVTLAPDPAIHRRARRCQYGDGVARPAVEPARHGDGLGGAGLPRYDERLPARRDDADDRAGADGEHRHVTIAAVNNAADTPDKSVDVTATVAGGNGVQPRRSRRSRSATTIRCRRWRSRSIRCGSTRVA